LQKRLFFLNFFAAKAHYAERFIDAGHGRIV